MLEMEMREMRLDEPGVNGCGMKMDTENVKQCGKKSMKKPGTSYQFK